MIRRALTVSTLLLVCAAPASAQLISIRTVPVSQAHQFDIFPSGMSGMGGVSIALADSLLEPFTNPATGSRIGATRFFGSPGVYSVSSDAGAGRTLPLGALARSGDWFGGFWLALQEVDMSERPVQPFFGLPCPECSSASLVAGPREESHGNAYGLAMAGRELRPGLSIGGSVRWSRLNAVDGVDLLYAGSAALDQSGHALDVRLGLLREWAGKRTLDLVVLHNRFSSAHDVTYLDMFWDPGMQQFAQRPRIEENLDRTNTWGLHLAWKQPLAAPGWSIGWVATANRMDHPKIPNYEIMNIPRDPGNSSAFNVGVGVGRVLDGTSFGMDVVYEPIWSHTWADAEEPIATSHGATIPAGGMTIENRFRFHNALLRMGVGQRVDLGEGAPAAGLQLGLALRRTDYRLEQHDHIQDTDRNHHERWWEWRPTWGLSLAFPSLEIRYHGSVTHGTGRPGVAQRDCCVLAVAEASSNILVAPSGPLTLDEVRVVTHQISIALPLR